MSSLNVFYPSSEEPDRFRNARFEGRGCGCIWPLHSSKALAVRHRLAYEGLPSLTRDTHLKLRPLFTLTNFRPTAKLKPSSSSSSSLPVFPFHTNKVHLPLILVPPADQFRHVFRRMLLAAMAPDAVPAPAPAPAPAPTRPGLRKIAPYWYPYTTMAKGRWLNREILEIVSTEFRDRSIEYYVWAFFFGSFLYAGGAARSFFVRRDTRWSRG